MTIGKKETIIKIEPMQASTLESRTTTTIKDYWDLKELGE